MTCTELVYSRADSFCFHQEINHVFTPRQQFILRRHISTIDISLNVVIKYSV